MNGSSRSGKQRGFVRCNYDALNSETFGDTAGVSGDDWMAAHDAFVSGLASDSTSTSTEEEVLSDSLSRQIRIKELWPTSPAQPSKPSDSIWSSPELPHRPPTEVLGSPALPTGHKVTRLEDLEQGYNTPPHPETTPTNQPLGPPPGLRMPRMPPPGMNPPIRLPPHFLLGPPQLLPPGFPPFIRPHPQHMQGFPPPPQGSPRQPLLPPSAFHQPPRGPFSPPHPARWPMPVQSEMIHTRVKSRRSEYLDEMKSDGSGFMTQKEKEWVIKIQLIQLQSCDINNEDYYYMNYVRRKQARASNQLSHTHNKQSDQSDEPQILALPNIVHDERKYRPAVFSGALGKLTVSSVAAPRKRIDVSVGGSDPGSQGKKKQAFIVIEKLYSEVLRLEELERKALAVAEEDRGSMLVTRDKIRTDMLALLQIKHSAARTELALFHQLMTVRKGKRLIRRLLPLLTDDQAKAVLLGILHNLSTIIKKDSTDQVLNELSRSVSAVISTFDLSTINVCVRTVLDSSFSGLVRVGQSDFGARVLNELLTKGLTLSIRTNLPVDDIEKWHMVAGELSKELLTHKDQLSSNKAFTGALLSTLATL